MNARRLALSAAVAGSVLYPLAVATPAHATHCPPGSVLVTASGLYFPNFGPAAVNISFVAMDPFGGICAYGSLSGHCPVVTIHDTSQVGLIALANEGESCVTGADRFMTGIWVD